MEQIICSGALFYSLTTQRFLFLHRTQSKQNNVWGLVGGTNEDKEIPYKALLREIEEELGSVPTIIKSIPLETFVSNDSKFSFHTYLCIVDNEFIPILNAEHDSYAWCSYKSWPKPLHIGLKSSLSNNTIKKKLETVFDIIDFI